ncbi:MAG: hypothetical protein PF489_01825, partial [Salinivirgaceae bacterium]|nr:hypothetical protein [Salinivirgaceae bacterium]
AFSLLRNQGLFIKYDNDNSWSRVDFVPIDSNQYRITIAAKPKIQVSISIPYSSADVDKLATLVSGNKNINIRTLGVEPRTFKIFDFGKDDGKKPIHYFIAGEDLFETASMWTADAMIRYLTDNPDVLAEITAHHILRIVPAMSPYSLNKTNNYSFLDDDDNPIYGAATWGDDLPAGELKYMRNEVVGIFPPSTEPSYLNSKRLHWVLNMHSWWAQANYTNLQASNKTKSGVTLIDNENSSRQKWLEDFLISNIEGIPRKHYEISTTWRAGLPRDYFLAKYNFITSVIEVCTYKQGMPEFTATGQAIINNLKNKGNDYDWSKLYAPKE